MQRDGEASGRSTSRREAGVATEVVACGAGSAACQETLRTAMALGADRAILVQSDAELQPLAGGNQWPDAGALPLAEAFGEDHFEHPDHRRLWTLIAARLESGKSFLVQDVVADADVPTLKLLAGELYETGSRRTDSADALHLLQAAAADLDRMLRQSAETPLPSGKALDATTLQAVLERRRREGHRPGAIARSVRGDARTATAGPRPANSP